MMNQEEGRSAAQPMPLNRAQRRAQAKAKTAKRPARGYVISNTVEMAINGATRVPQQVVESYIAPLKDLLARIKLGREEFGEWTRIRDAVCVTQALMELDAAKAHLVEELVHGWFLAIDSAVTRRRKGPRDGLIGKEREELGLLLVWYETMLSGATQQQLLEAQRLALRRVKADLAVINKEIRAQGLPECSLGRELAQVEALAGDGV